MKAKEYREKIRNMSLEELKAENDRINNEVGR